MKKYSAALCVLYITSSSAPCLCMNPKLKNPQTYEQKKQNGLSDELTREALKLLRRDKELLTKDTLTFLKRNASVIQWFLAPDSEPFVHLMRHLNATAHVIVKSKCPAAEIWEKLKLNQQHKEVLSFVSKVLGQEKENKEFNQLITQNNTAMIIPSFHGHSLVLNSSTFFLYMLTFNHHLYNVAWQNLTPKNRENPKFLTAFLKHAPLYLSANTSSFYQDLDPELALYFHRPQTQAFPISGALKKEQSLDNFSPDSSDPRPKSESLGSYRTSFKTPPSPTLNDSGPKTEDIEQEKRKLKAILSENSSLSCSEPSAASSGGFSPVAESPRDKMPKHAQATSEDLWSDL